MIPILFLAANPIDQAHLRVRQEFDELRQALDSAAHGRRFILTQEFAAAADQLQALLFRHRPHIVHFSGHGTAGGLVFEGSDGSSHLVAPQTLHDLFAGFKQQVRCVVLNACCSEAQATAIATVIDSVVGMSDTMTDDAALAFAVAFHRALANDATLADAVALGRNQLDLQNLDEAHKPQLLAERIDPSRVRALDWDDSPSADDQEAIVFIPFPRKVATEFVGRDAELIELHEELLQQIEQHVARIQREDDLNQLIDLAFAVMVLPDFARKVQGLVSA